MMEKVLFKLCTFFIHIKGDQINIPVVLISEEDGEKLLKYLTDTDPLISKSVALQVKFDMVCFYFNASLISQPVTDFVIYEFWMSSENYKSYDILQEMKDLDSYFVN